MFVVEAYLKKRRDKVQAWKDAGKAEVRAQKKVNEYSYYEFRDWERNHPYPVVKWEKVAQVVVPAVLGFAAIFSLVFFVLPANSNDSKKTPNKPAPCTTIVKKGESVGISYGSFQGSKGTVVQQTKDCSVDITLTDSTNSFDQCEKNSDSCSGSLNNGKILHINKSDNVIPL